MKVIIFGIDRCYEDMKCYFQNEEIVTLLDNDPDKIDTFKDKMKVLPPSEGEGKIMTGSLSCAGILMRYACNF